MTALDPADIRPRYRGYAGFITTPKYFDDSPQQFLAVAPDGVGVIQRVLHVPDYAFELEDRTLNVLVLKPISRLSIVVPKLLGSIIVTGPVLVAAGVAVTAIALGGGGARALLATAAALSTGVIVYAAVFTWAGLISSRSLGFALVYVFLWEGLVTNFLSGARYLSVRGYTLGILHGLDEETFTPLAGRVIELPAAIVGAALVTIAFFVLTVRRLQRMDVQ